MKPIKIVPANAAAIIDALHKFNGRALSHTYTLYSEIEGLAEAAEKKLERLNILKKDRAGAVYYATSGSAVSNAYAKKGRVRAATFVQLERRSSGWFINTIRADTIYQSGGYERITLTKAQAETAIKEFSRGFNVAS